MSDAPPSKKRRLRFSLLNFLLLMTITAMGVGLYRSKQRNDQLAGRNKALEAENLKHRNTLGIFDIEDPEMVHSIRLLRTEGPDRFRIYLPEGRRYRACYQVNGIPETETPYVYDSHTIEPGEYLIAVQLQRTNDRETGEPTPSMKISLDINATGGQQNSSLGQTIGVSEGKIDWILNKETGSTEYSTSSGVGRSLRLHHPEAPLVVLRVRAHEVVVTKRRDDGRPQSWTTRNRSGPTDGFILWIEPIEENTGD